MAILRSFPSQVFGGSDPARLTYRTEQAMIQNRIPFQIIYDHQLADLARYRALVLAGCVAMSDSQAAQIKQYIESGGRLCIIGPAATCDEWMRRRDEPALDDVPADHVVRIDENGDMIDAVRQACGRRLSMSVQAEPGLCSELTEQAGRRLVHLVNYRPDDPAKDVLITLRVPAKRDVEAITLASPERDNDLDLDFQARAGTVTFRVPQVRTYEIAIARLK